MLHIFTFKQVDLIHDLALFDHRIPIMVNAGNHDVNEDPDRVTVGGQVFLRRKDTLSTLATRNPFGVRPTFRFGQGASFSWQSRRNFSDRTMQKRSNWQKRSWSGLNLL